MTPTMAVQETGIQTCCWISQFLNSLFYITSVNEVVGNVCANHLGVVPVNRHHQKYLQKGLLLPLKLHFRPSTKPEIQNRVQMIFFVLFISLSNSPQFLRIGYFQNKTHLVYSELLQIQKNYLLHICKMIQLYPHKNKNKH